jgi:hypothetical protein
MMAAVCGRVGRATGGFSMQINTVKGIQSVKRMKDSAEPKINIREKALGRRTH